MDWKAEFLKRLDALGEKLGVAANHLWAVLVRQGMAEAIGSLVLAVFSLAGLIASVKVLQWARKTAEGKRDKYDDWPGQYVFWSIASGAGLVLSIVALCINAYQFTIWAVNPEYFALEKILSVLGK